MSPGIDALRALLIEANGGEAQPSSPAAPEAAPQPGAAPLVADTTDYRTDAERLTKDIIAFADSHGLAKAAVLIWIACGEVEGLTAELISGTPRSEGRFGAVGRPKPDPKATPLAKAMAAKRDGVQALKEKSRASAMGPKPGKGLPFDSLHADANGSGMMAVWTKTGRTPKWKDGTGTEFAATYTIEGNPYTQAVADGFAAGSATRLKVTWVDWKNVHPDEFEGRVKGAFDGYKYINNRTGELQVGLRPTLVRPSDD